MLHTGATEVIDEIPLVVGNERRYFNAIYVPWRNERGEIEGVMTLGNDVTQEVNVRRAIEESVSSLRTERELRERFVAALTHDLRTPLTASKISAQLILRKTDLEQLQKLASRIVSNMNRADEMIRDLLDASRINAGESLPLEIGECDLHTVIVSTLDDLASVHGDRFVFQSPGTVVGYWDCSVIRRMIENLCNNAVKYGSGMSPITVILKKRDDVIELAIHNEGNPISPEDQQYIFRPYQRLKSAVKSSQKGWGIGLTLVHGFTEALGGTAKVESSAEKGTTFYICLPYDSRKVKV
ncbi:MAG: ATP-binding protein [Bacteriovoracia bacterium]